MFLLLVMLRFAPPSICTRMMTALTEGGGSVERFICGDAVLSSMEYMRVWSNAWGGLWFNLFGVIVNIEDWSGTMCCKVWMD